MYTRHVEGRPKFINKIIALSKGGETTVNTNIDLNWRLPPCTPDIYGFSSYIEEQGGPI